MRRCIFCEEWDDICLCDKVKVPAHHLKSHVEPAPRSIDLVRAFHIKHGAPVNSTPDIDPARVRLRLDLIAEEFKELCEAVGYEADIRLWQDPERTVDIVAAADALADSRYVGDGTAVEWGIPLEECVAEVHRSNMTKDVGEKRGDGKIRKGESYSPPDLASVLWPEGRK